MPYIVVGPRDEYEIYVDDEDVYTVQQHRWLVAFTYSAASVVRVAKPQIRLARLLMNPPNGLVVDHLDGNILNNSRSNLRICTRAENSMNAHKRNWSSTHNTRKEARRAAYAMKRELYGEHASIQRITKGD